MVLRWVTLCGETRVPLRRAVAAGTSAKTAPMSARITASRGEILMSMIDDARQSRASCRAPLALAVSAALLSAAPTIGSAQGQRSGGLEEIVVTARYREENIQTTPIAISAFSGEELTLRSIDNVEDIGVIVPNAFFRKNVGNYGPNNTIGLRGLNQVDRSEERRVGTECRAQAYRTQ